MCEPVHISLKFSVPEGIAVGMPVTGRPPGHRRVSVHAGGGVLGGSAVPAAVELRWPSGQAAKVELQDFNLKRARGPDDR